VQPTIRRSAAIAQIKKGGPDTTGYDESAMRYHDVLPGAFRFYETRFLADSISSSKAVFGMRMQRPNRVCGILP